MRLRDTLIESTVNDKLMQTNQLNKMKKMVGATEVEQGKWFRAKNAYYGRFITSQITFTFKGGDSIKGKPGAVLNDAQKKIEPVLDMVKKFYSGPEYEVSISGGLGSTEYAMPTISIIKQLRNE